MRFITESIVYEGSPTVAVVNYTKDWYFNGSGVDKVPGIRDTAKWVPNSFVHKSECGPPANDIYPRTTRRPNSNSWWGLRSAATGFTDSIYSASEDHSKPFKLCYMFGDEPWKLFDVYVVSSQVNSVKATTVGVDGQASLGENKIFAISGFGVNANDRVSWALTLL